MAFQLRSAQRPSFSHMPKPSQQPRAYTTRFCFGGITRSCFTFGRDFDPVFSKL